MGILSHVQFSFLWKPAGLSPWRSSVTALGLCISNSGSRLWANTVLLGRGLQGVQICFIMSISLFIAKKSIKWVYSGSHFLAGKLSDKFEIWRTKKSIILMVTLAPFWLTFTFSLPRTAPHIHRWKLRVGRWLDAPVALHYPFAGTVQLTPNFWECCLLMVHSFPFLTMTQDLEESLTKKCLGSYTLSQGQ